MSMVDWNHDDDGGEAPHEQFHREHGITPGQFLSLGFKLIKIKTAIAPRLPFEVCVREGYRGYFDDFDATAVMTPDHPRWAEFRAALSRSLDADPCQAHALPHRHTWTVLTAMGFDHQAIVAACDAMAALGGRCDCQIVTDIGAVRVEGPLNAADDDEADEDADDEDPVASIPSPLSADIDPRDLTDEQLRGQLQWMTMVEDIKNATGEWPPFPDDDPLQGLTFAQLRDQARRLLRIKDAITPGEQLSFEEWVDQVERFAAWRAEVDRRAKRICADTAEGDDFMGGQSI
jgi:hypothetical protein